VAVTAPASSRTGTTIEEERKLLTATVPLDGRSGGELVHLLDSAPSELTALPCRSHDPDLWFAEAPAELERAKQLCAGCPVKADCLASALSRHEPWGVWGGEIVERGAVVPRKRPRGRPSKADLERDRAERDAAA
jgi:WhiB family transcriptional regulator, redox-sensing transcriptional regulator